MRVSQSISLEPALHYVTEKGPSVKHVLKIDTSLLNHQRLPLSGPTCTGKMQPKIGISSSTEVNLDWTDSGQCHPSCSDINILLFRKSGSLVSASAGLFPSLPRILSQWKSRPQWAVTYINRLSKLKMALTSIENVASLDNQENFGKAMVGKLAMETKKNVVVEAPK